MSTTVLALIQRNGAFLSLQRSKGKDDGVVWSFPSGKVEDGETEEQALVREVQEETSIICTPTKRLGERILPNNNVLVYWLADYVEGTPTDPANKETSLVAFRTTAELLKLIPIERIHDCLKPHLGLS